MKKGFLQLAVSLLFRATEGKWPNQKLENFEVKFKPDGTFKAKLNVVQDEQAEIAKASAAFFRKADSINQVTFQYLDPIDREVYEVCVQKLSRPGLGKVNFALRTALEAITQGHTSPAELAKQVLGSVGYVDQVFTINRKCAICDVKYQSEDLDYCPECVAKSDLAA